MIDLHTHILPGLDDGSETMRDSILMAKLAAKSGVHSLVVTPHCNIEGMFHNYYGDDLKNRFLTFAEELKQEQIPIKIYPGMEIYGTEEVPELLSKGKLITLNHSRYPLIEFSFRIDQPLIDFLITEVIAQGFHPIIAHPERYPYVQRHPNIVYDWIDRGCYLQVNKGSILGSFGYKARITSLLLLDNNLISVIASDAHSPLHRTTDLSEIYLYVENNYSKEYADILLEENPYRILEDKELISL